MALYRAEGIILRRRSLGESDRLITLFTRNYGKIGCVAKGASKPKSRLGGRTELLMHGRYLLAEGRNLDIITQAELIDRFTVIRSELYLTAMASYFAELVDLFIGEREAHDDIFDLLMAGFLLLERRSRPELVARIFELRLMALLGYRPQLERCVRCEAMVAELRRFDVWTGGVVCRDCQVPAASMIVVSADALRLMRLMLTTDIGQLERAEISGKLLNEVERVMRAFIDYRSEGRVKSRDFLALVAEEHKDEEEVG